MPQYRLAIIQSLARQLAFAPLDVRHAQLAHAETLLDALDPAKSYPPDFVVFRITGYQPKTRVQGELLTGLALQHDVGILIEAVSAGMAIRAADVSEPVLSIDDVTARFNVTSKTIQRWRRKGLVSRRFVFADGKLRVGFLLSSIERFIARNSDAVCEHANLQTMSDAERAAIVRHARRLFARAGNTERDATRRLARRFRRSALTILHTLRKYDQMNPQRAVLPLARTEMSAVRRAKIVRAHRRGWSIGRIAARVRRSHACVYRAILDDRLERLGRRRMTFHDDELYHGDDAERAIETIVRASASTAESAARETPRIPSRLPPYIAELYRTPLLTPAQERALFLQLNYRKYRFVIARRQFDPETGRKRDLDRLERLAKSAGEVKNRIVAANLRLVVSVARKHVPASAPAGVSPTLMELVSEGNVILMRAAESFDIHKNVRFSTYATFALMKGFARLVPELRNRARSGHADVGEMELADRRETPLHKRLADREEVARLMGLLSPSERRVIAAHFGLGHGIGHGSTERAVVTSSADARHTHDRLGRELGLSRHRIREIEKHALQKLRASAMMT